MGLFPLSRAFLCLSNFYCLDSMIHFSILLGLVMDDKLDDLGANEGWLENCWANEGDIITNDCERGDGSENIGWGSSKTTLGAKKNLGFC